MRKYATILIGGLAFFGVNILLDILFNDGIDIKGCLAITGVFIFISLIMEFFRTQFAKKK